MPILQPDAAVVTAVVPSPNHNERHGQELPDILLLHYTGMASSSAALSKLCDGAPANGPKVSAHYFVDEDGTVIQCVAEARRAWHAGLSSWEGHEDINSRSIGIEIVNPGHEFGYPDFPERQIAAVVALCADILGRRRIRPDRVLGHSDVAPARKRDPGEKFPWQRLADAGIGLWVESPAMRTGAVLEPSARGDAVTELQRSLAAYGYGIEPTGTYDAATADVVTAFQRHFRPALVDARADPSTIDTLARLLAARDRLLRRPDTGSDPAVS
jgi:N-acetylmuramoyl-L-alanine amidase